MQPGSQKKAISAVFVTGAIIFANMYLTQPILPILSQEFGLAPSTAGLSVSIVVLMIAAGSIAAGPLSDRIGRKPIMVWSSFLLVLPTILGAFASSFNMLLLCRALQGLFIPGLTAVAVAYLGEIVEPDKLGQTVGGWIAANVVGGFLGRLTSGIITDFLGWRSVFACYAMLVLAGAALLAYVLPTDSVSSTGDWASAYRGMLIHLRSRRLLGGYLIGGALLFGFIGLYTYLPYYLTAAPFYLPTALVAFAYVSYLAGTVTSPLAGKLSTHISRRLLTAIGLLIAILGIALTLIQSLPIIGLSLLVLCSGMFTVQAIMPAYVNTAAESAKGSAGALYQVFYYLGGTLGGVLPGLAWQSVGWNGVTAVCAAAFALALLANWLLCRDE
jgi:YNFM family putative membrane transporter